MFALLPRMDIGHIDFVGNVNVTDGTLPFLANLKVGDIWNISVVMHSNLVII